MDFSISYRNNIFILGAGASKDYGLPTWKELDSKIKSKLKNSGTTHYSQARDVLKWLEKVGDENEYKTIDECIEKESIKGPYRENGDLIENELFMVMKDIFDEVYKNNDSGWITKLNNKILHRSSDHLENKMAFVSYNYDNVLEKNFLNFNYLPGKHQRLNHRDRLSYLANTVVPVLYAHGNLYLNSEIPQPSHTERVLKTMKTGAEGYIDAVSCYESHEHGISHNVNADLLNLYIMGLGGGLMFNLSKLHIYQKISNIYVTISNSDNDHGILDFLAKKFKIPLEKIFVFRTCNELIDGAVK